MIPRFLYGTAWKEERTEELVRLALAAGFRGIDTANQRKHYHEAGVGAAIGGVNREELFLQTKFTYAEGQDQRLPYDPRASFTDQVRQSFQSSLAHLGTDRIDSYLLHGPRTRHGLSDGDRETWRAMEALQREGRTRFIGVSNVTAEQVSTLCGFAEVRPTFVQNRCYAQLGWDRAVRDVCRAEGITYQGFSLLTANVRELQSRAMQRIAAKYGVPATRIVFRFALEVGMLPLTGTTDPEHMRDDLAALDFEMDRADVEAVEAIAFS